MSTVVSTLIIILLVLVAIGIIWVVIQGVISESGEQISHGTKCVSTNINIANIGTCDDTDGCVVEVEKQGGYAIDGLIAVVSNSSASGTSEDVGGDFDITKTFTVPSTKVPASPTNVKVSAYIYNSESGENVTCAQVTEAAV